HPEARLRHVFLRGPQLPGAGRPRHAQEGDRVPGVVSPAQDARPGREALRLRLPSRQGGPCADHRRVAHRRCPGGRAAPDLRSHPGGPGKSHRRGTLRESAHHRGAGWAAGGQAGARRGGLHRDVAGRPREPGMTDRARILVVDDEMGPRESLRMILKPRHALATADSGEAALRTLKSFHPDLIFMDIKMPQMDGIELLRRIKGIDPSIEVVMITAYASLETVKNALTHGAFEYLIKPFSRQDLEETVRRALARRLTEIGTRSQLSSLVEEMRALSGKTRDLEEEARREQAEQSLRVTQLSILREISRGLLGQLDLAQLVATITEQLRSALGYDEVRIHL